MGADDFLDLPQHLCKWTRPLREEDQLRRISRSVPAQHRTGGKPASVATHDLHDLHRIGPPHGRRVQASLADGERHIARSATVARAVVHPGEVVVDRLGNPNRAESESARMAARFKRCNVSAESLPPIIVTHCTPSLDSD